jgi:hypothetical protein
MMIADSMRIAKFSHITPAEQLRRFKDRHPLKRWKLSYEDFRNRSRWAEYEAATEDMMRKTSPKWAAWYLIPANDKLYGRLAVFTILIEILGKGLSLKPRPVDPQVAEMGEAVIRPNRREMKAFNCARAVGMNGRRRPASHHPSALSAAWGCA